MYQSRLSTEGDTGAGAGAGKRNGWLWVLILFSRIPQFARRGEGRNRTGYIHRGELTARGSSGRNDSPGPLVLLTILFIYIAGWEVRLSYFVDE